VVADESWSPEAQTAMKRAGSPVIAPRSTIGGGAKLTEGGLNGCPGQVGRYCNPKENHHG